MPFGAVWDHHCRTHDVPPGRDWLAEVKAYEREVLSQTAESIARSCSRAEGTEMV